MIRISQLKLAVPHTEEQLEKKIMKALHLKQEELISWQIRRQSLDARKKPELFYVYTVDVEVKKEASILKRAKGQAQQVNEKSYKAPLHGEEELKGRPVVIGSGPAGLFCGYLLALEGYNPLIIERGAPAQERKKDVEKFWETGVLDTTSNVQFGEGGAGTFSDGKLNTLVKDKNGRNRFVLETFVKFGAPEEILYAHKPHIGTDILITVVTRMREAILELGGEFRFHTQVTDFVAETRELELVKHDTGNSKDLEEKTKTADEKEKIKAGAAVFAIGHSARDTFEMLYGHHLSMTAKSFAVGVRVEHPQTLIDHSQYGRERGKDFPAAAYKLTEKLENGRGVYTFCMCPGGYVVNASSEEGRLAVNGMSYSDRAGENANSAVIATVTPEDFGSDHPLAGIAFQRKLEENAYQAGQGKIPVQKFGDFKENRLSSSFGNVRPNMRGMYTFGNVRGIFPTDISQSLEEGICAMGKKIHGFDDEDVLLSGVESRTSSPVRIERNETFTADGFDWIYPCGEGAGYAGGITSAAMDGLKVAEAIIAKYHS